MDTYLDLFPGCSVAADRRPNAGLLPLWRRQPHLARGAGAGHPGALEQERAGGAANVAASLASLGLRVRLVGLTGKDAVRDELIESTTAPGGVDCSGVVAASHRQTIRKLRIIGAHQQIARIDDEDTLALTPGIEDCCIRAACDAIEATDVAVISDYNKGLCTDRLLRAAIDHAILCGKKILVDPKRRDLAVYRGASILTPNRKKLSDATGMPCEDDARPQPRSPWRRPPAGRTSC